MNRWPTRDVTVTVFNTDLGGARDTKTNERGYYTGRPASRRAKTVELKNAQRQSVGSATISEEEGGKGITIQLNLKNLPRRSMRSTSIRTRSVDYSVIPRWALD
jgi:hypothetical protein